MGDAPATLKWGKATYPLAVQPGTPALALKRRIQSLTGVPVGRQKLLCPRAWKGALHDDDVLPDKLAAGKKAVVITLIGSAETLVEKSVEERPRFAEDMTPEELWRATKPEGGDEKEGDAVDVIALQREAGMDRDDGKMEMYQYDRLVRGLPQHQINDMLVSRKRQGAENDDNPEPATSAPLLGEVAMTMGMELRRAYVNSLAVLPDGTLVSGLDDGHVQLWRRGSLVKDARHPTARVDCVVAFPPPSSASDPAFVTAGDGALCLWTEEGTHLMQFASFPGTTPASIAVGTIGDEDGGIAYLAACFRITRQVDPHRFRLVPQNEVERQRRDAALAQERMIQNELSRASRCIKVWLYRESAGGARSVVEDVISPEDFDGAAPITELLDIRGSSRMACGDACGGIRILEWTGRSGPINSASASYRELGLMQFRQSSIACMAQVDGTILAVSIRPEPNAGALPSATPLHATRPRGIYVLDSKTSTIKAVLDAHSDTVQSICPLPDGSMLSAGGKMDATVRVWEISNAVEDSNVEHEEVKVITEARILKQPGYVFDLKVLPDSNGSSVYAIAAARYNVIKIVI